MGSGLAEAVGDQTKAGRMGKEVGRGGRCKVVKQAGPPNSSLAATTPVWKPRWRGVSLP